MTGKTLKELNVQVGDVVKSVYTGYLYPVRAMNIISNADHHVAKWEIVSRAKKYTAWQFTDAPENAETHTMPDGLIEWRVEVNPVVRTVELTRQPLGQWFYSCETGSHKLTYTTIDGEIDCASVKMVIL
jgi:hypothetical protein